MQNGQYGQYRPGPPNKTSYQGSRGYENKAYQGPRGYENKAYQGSRGYENKAHQGSRGYENKAYSGYHDRFDDIDIRDGHEPKIPTRIGK